MFFKKTVQHLSGWAEALPEDIEPVSNKRAKRLILRKRRDGRGFRLTVPPRTTLAKALGFIEAQRAWLEKGRRDDAATQIIRDGTELTILDQPLKITYGGVGARKRSVEQEGALVIYGDEALVGKRAVRYLKEKARLIFTDKAAYYADKGGLEFNKIRITDTKSCWGSCSAKGVISLSWRLLMAPEYVLDYVIAHEVSHLKHMDHSAQFWGFCESLEPRTKKAKAWLKKQGSHLHRIDVD